MTEEVQQDDELKELTTEEQQRLDSLFSAARSAHYLSILVAATTVVLAAAPTRTSINIPLLMAELPRLHAAIASYMLTISLAAVADRAFRVAYDWHQLDPRRPIYPWFPLGVDQISFHAVSLWLVAPVVVAAVTITFILGSDRQGGAFVLAGILLAGMPRVVDNYLPLIKRRLDHRGGPATFSMWLLYGYRIVRQLFGTVTLLLLVLAAAPEWRESMLVYIKYAVAVIILLMVVRAPAGLLYKKIDRAGARFGFPTTNAHDYK